MITILENYDLQSLNTLAVPSYAQWFAEITDENQLLAALEFQKQQQCSLLILGGGSNVVLPEKVNGLVLKMATTGHSIVAETDKDIIITFAAGENWHSIVMWCVEQGYYGIENLALIPGCIGAAPIQNIGAYGVELKDCFESLNAINIDSGEAIYLDVNQCQFDYRDSIFKRGLLDKVIITDVTLRLKKIPNLTLAYPALKNALQQENLKSLTPLDVANAVIEIRESKLPSPSDIPNAGSFFKNPIVSESVFQKLKKQYPQLVAYPQKNNAYKLAAGWLLDNAGWKGKVVNGVCMHHQQALVLTNPQRCTSDQLLHFIEIVRTSIQEKFNIQLEIEPRIFNS